MSVVISCKSCDHDWMVADRYGGRRVKCPQCDTFVRVPKLNEEEVDEVEDQDAENRAPEGSQQPLTFSVSFPNRDRQNAATVGALFGLLGGILYLLFKSNADSNKSMDLSNYSSATITKKGLRLRASVLFGGKTYMIPRGSKAKYIDGKRLQLDLPGGKVEMWVTGFRVYRKRLARDLVRFLKNEKELDAEDYEVPWLLIFSIFLPFLLSLATLFVTLPREIKPGMERDMLAMGGAVIVATLLAGLMSVVCQMFVQNYKWPVGMRALACLGLLAICSPLVPVLRFLAHHLALAAWQ